MKGWPGGATESLCLAGEVTAVGESGFIEATEFGYAPMGRGRDGEAGLTQMMTRQIPRFAGWLPKEERERLANASNEDLEAWVQAEYLGEKNLDHMWEASLRALASSRASCTSSVGTSWTYGMWSRYGTGTTCKASGKFAMQRSNWFMAWQTQCPHVKAPVWAEEALHEASETEVALVTPTE